MNSNNYFDSCQNYIVVSRHIALLHTYYYIRGVISPLGAVCGITGAPVAPIFVNILAVSGAYDDVAVPTSYEFISVIGFVELIVCCSSLLSYTILYNVFDGCKN